MIANDLNPNSYKYLLQNALGNKVNHKLSAFCLDAREFLNSFLNTKRTEEVKIENNLESPPFESLPATFDHLYMNLPMDAVEFLDVLKGNFDRNVWKKMPLVHVYSFSKVADAKQILLSRIHQVLGGFDEDSIRIVQVRDISPRKFMFCIEFVMPEEIAYKKVNFEGDSVDVLKKKRKLHD